ncbi:hypothetical protein Pth03_18400 [Planotetraspora thailandica]|uniref:Lipoprotein n=1 Tax=Planotetraspora thailandica TaxID=487172 RepID=A0A8J3XV87_9ACTN|nr:hypothetical protein [Planotetraspora thailandica]GII53451.1 hypothetical protein Pth03_18400 [Planotetraspora thailandica]
MRLPTMPVPVRVPVSRLPAAGVAGLLILGVACAAPGSAKEPPVYVLNLYGAEEGRSDQKPGDLTVSEFSTLNGVTWQSWGPTRAAGSGELTGSWCLPQCMDTPYTATVTLSNVAAVKGKGYFTKYEITAQLPQDQRDKADLTGTLPTP